MTTKEIAEKLWSTRTSFDELQVPSTPGVYAWFLAGSDHPAQLAVLPRHPVYVGVSGNLSRRELDNHFSSGSTGFSTLRRSLGALLKEELGLSAVPRSAGASETNVTNYRFEPEGEERLTSWMRSHLLVGVCPAAEDAELERALITLLCPPLNLTGWDNPVRREIKRLRKACADEARARRVE